MNYKRKDFEEAALKLNKSVVFESIKARTPENTVVRATGTVRIGNIIKSVVWDENGKAKTKAGNRIPAYDLPL